MFETLSYIFENLKVSEIELKALKKAHNHSVKELSFGLEMLSLSIIAGTILSMHKWQDYETKINKIEDEIERLKNPEGE